MKTGIYDYNRKDAGFELKRLVAMLLVLVQCASLAFVGAPVAYAEEPQKDAVVMTQYGEHSQDPDEEIVVIEDEDEDEDENIPEDEPEDEPEGETIFEDGILDAELGDGLSVSVSYEAEAEIPANATLEILLPGYGADDVPDALNLTEDEAAYYVERMYKELGVTDSDRVFSEPQLFELRILDEEGGIVTPACAVEVCFRFPLADSSTVETWSAVSFDETAVPGANENTTVLGASGWTADEGCALRFEAQDFALFGVCSWAKEHLMLQMGNMEVSVFAPACAQVRDETLMFAPEDENLLLEDARSLHVSSDAPDGATALWAVIRWSGRDDAETNEALYSLIGTALCEQLHPSEDEDVLISMGEANGFALLVLDPEVPLYSDDMLTLEGEAPIGIVVTVADVTGDFVDFDFSSLGEALPEPEPTPVVQPRKAPLFAGWRKAFQMVQGIAEEQGVSVAQSSAQPLRQDKPDRSGFELIGAYDISLSLEKGEYQPDEDHPITVKITNPAIDEDRELQLWHIHDDNSSEEITNFWVEGNTLIFSATGFSIYLITAAPVMSFRFYTESGDECPIYDDAGNPQYEQRVKKNEKPIVPQPPAVAGSEFAGWYEWDAVSGEWADQAYDFDNIEFEANAQVYLYARYRDYFHVTLYGQYDSETDTFPVAYDLRGELVTDGEANYAHVKIGGLSVNYEGGNDKAFYGWSETPVKVPGESGTPVVTDAEGYIDVTEDTQLYPVFKQVYWLNFFSGPTGSSATYFPPERLFDGIGLTSLEDRITSLANWIPERDGYVFQGWYTGTQYADEKVDYADAVSDGAGELILGVYGDVAVIGGDAGKQLSLSGNVTLYAKWQATYRIVIWKQKTTDEWGIPEAEKTYEIAESVTLPAEIGATVSVRPEDKEKAYDGWAYNRCDDPKEVRDAKEITVLNVYYDLSEPYHPGTEDHTLTFKESVTVPGEQSPDLPDPMSFTAGDDISDNLPEAPSSGRDKYTFSGWYSDGSCTTRVFFKADSEYSDYSGSKILYDRMPDHDLDVYAGWQGVKYGVEVDPNYGALYYYEGTELKGTGATWFNNQYGTDPAIGEYTHVTRDYVESSSGTWYYVKHDLDYYHGNPPKDADRKTYYTQNPDEATDFTTYEYVPGAYTYAGWYEVMEDGSEKLYEFGHPVDHPTRLKLHWKKNSIHYIKYEAGDGMMDTTPSVKELFAPGLYADNSSVTVMYSAVAPSHYTFVGWRVRGDESGTLYGPGQSLRLNSDYSQTIAGKDTIFLDAVYVQVGRATVIYDANGGTLAGSGVDFGMIPGTTEEWTSASGVLDTTAGTAKVPGLANNSRFKLSSGAGFSRDGMALVGWSIDSVCDPADSSAQFFDLEATCIVDTVDDPVILYAVWGVPVTYHLNLPDGAASTDFNWGGDWPDPPYQKDETENTYSQTAYYNAPISEPGYQNGETYTLFIPEYTGTGEWMFRYWATESSGTSAYDFSQPVRGALDLYAHWSQAEELPVQAMLASSGVLTPEPDWVKTIDSSAEKVKIRVGTSELVLNAADYISVPDSKYEFAFAAVADEAGRGEEVKSVYYNSAEKQVYVKFKDESMPDVPLSNEVGIAFVFFEKTELSITYQAMSSTGTTELSLAEAGAPTETSAIGGSSFALAGEVTAPMAWVTEKYPDGGYQHYVFAVGDGSQGLKAISSVASGDTDRPVLLLRNTWRGFQYRMADDAETPWVDCSASPKLFVIYYERIPTIITVKESTVGMRDLVDEEEFQYSVSITSEGLAPQSFSFQLKNGESRTLTAYSWTTEDPNVLGVQTVTVEQTAKDSFSTTNSCTEGSSTSPTVWTYTTSDAVSAPVVTFTNRHKAQTVEVHVALLEDGHLVLHDELRSTEPEKYSFDLALGAMAALQTKLPPDQVFSGDPATYENYALATIFSGTLDGTAITASDGSDDLRSIAYEKTSGSSNIYALKLTNLAGETLELGNDEIFYLYIPMPKIVYVKETSEGLVRLTETTNGGNAVTMNGQTVTQDQQIQVPMEGMLISQTGGAGSFRMPPILDEKIQGSETHLSYLSFARLAVDSAGAIGGAALRLKVTGKALQYSLDGGEWAAMSAPPTVYAVYEERGYDLQIGKTLPIPAEEKDNEVFTGKTFTVTITSDPSTAIKAKTYQAEGIEGGEIAAEAGRIVLTNVKDGDKIKIKGLGYGTYTITESENENYTLTARVGPSLKTLTPSDEVTVQNNKSFSLTLDGEKKAELTNTPVPICRVTGHDFYTLNAALNYIRDNIQSHSATIEMLTHYEMPAGDALTIPEMFNIKLTTVSGGVSGGRARITRGTDLKDVPMFSNYGSLTLEGIILDGKPAAATESLAATTAMIVSVDTLTIGSGAEVTRALSTGNGGAIYVESGKVTLTATNNPNAEGVLSNNRADKGGAIYVENGTVELKAGADLTGNKAQEGGAIYIKNGSLQMTGGTVHGNGGTETAAGGAIYSESALVSVTGGTLGGDSANTAVNGGAIYSRYAAVEISGTNTVVKNNNATGNGGAVYVDSGSVSVSVCSITSNHAADLGGAIYADSGTVSLTSGTIGGEGGANTAANGAALFVNTGTANFTGGAITGNTATAGGAVGIGDEAVRLNFGGTIRIRDNKLGTADDAPECNVYLDKDTNAVICTSELNRGDVGIYVPDKNNDQGEEYLFKNRGAVGAEFGTYSGASITRPAFHNDRESQLVAVVNDNTRRIYWSSKIKVKVHYLASYSGGLPDGRNGTQNYSESNYYPAVGNTAISLLADELRIKCSNLPSSAVYAAALIQGNSGAAVPYEDYVTRLLWKDNMWKLEKRDGTTVELGSDDWIVIYYSVPAFVSIENNSPYDFNLSKLKVTMRGDQKSLLNSPSTPGYSLVFARDGSIQEELLPAELNGDGNLVLKKNGGSIILMIPGGRDLPYTLEGGFVSGSGDVKLRRTGETETSLNAANPVGFDGRTLNSGETYEIIFGEDKYICKIVYPSGEEVRYTTLRNAVQDAEQRQLEDVKIEMLVAYLMPSTDVVKVTDSESIAQANPANPPTDPGYIVVDKIKSLTFTTAREGEYFYPGSDRATISRGNGNVLFPMITVNCSDIKSISVKLEDLDFDGKALEGKCDGGALKTVNCTVDINYADFKNFISYNGGALFISYGTEKRLSNIKYSYEFSNYYPADAARYTLSISNANFSNCHSKPTPQRSGGGGVWTNAKLLEMDTCTFESCTAKWKEVDQGGAVFHRIEAENKEYAVTPYNRSSVSDLTDCTFTNCYAAAGGGIESDALTVTMRGCKFYSCGTIKADNNKDGKDGGAINIYIYEGSLTYNDKPSTVLLDGCEFVGCSAIRNGGAIRSLALDTTIQGCTFTNTTARGATVSGNPGGSVAGGGGAVYINNTAANSLTITDSTFTGTKVTNNGNGGAVSTVAKQLTISGTTGTTFTNCECPGSGGAVYHVKNAAGSFSRFDHVTMDGCKAKASGGGYYTDYIGEARFQDSTIKNCTATNGNGGGICHDTSAPLIFINTTVSGNNISKATGYGGGVYCKKNLFMQDSYVRDNQINANGANVVNAAGVYIYDNAGKLTIGSGSGTDHSCVENNTLKNGAASNLRLPEKGNGENQLCVTLDCDGMDGYVGVVNAWKAGTQFGLSQNTANPYGFDTVKHVFNADTNTLYGIVDRQDSTGKKIIWAGPPIAKITDAEGNLLYFKADGTDPAIFDVLEDGAAAGRTSAFAVLRDTSLKLYDEQGNRYTGTDYCVKMLVENYTVDTQITTTDSARANLIILTTAGKNDTDGYPYEGKGSPTATITASPDIIGSMMVSNCSMRIESITLDGGSADGRTSDANGGIICSLKSLELREDGVLQNASATGNGGGVYMVEGEFLLNGGRIQNCSAPNGGGVYLKSAGAFKAGRIQGCTTTGDGGGVYVETDFRMEGATISGNGAVRGGGVFVADNGTMHMSGGFIQQNNASEKGGGVAVGGPDSRLIFSLRPTVSGNTSDGSVAEEKRCNVELELDTNLIINTDGVGVDDATDDAAGLSNGAYIGVYVPGEEVPDSQYDKHGDKGKPFGTWGNWSKTTTLYGFVNDRNGYKGGLLAGQEESDTNIYWVESFSLLITKTVEASENLPEPSSAAEPEKFWFRVTLTDSSAAEHTVRDIAEEIGIGNTIEFGQITFKSDGVNLVTDPLFYLEDGGSVKAENLPFGIMYKVEEILGDEQYYSPIPSAERTGTIGENVESSVIAERYTSKADFTNLDPVCKITDMDGTLLYYRYDQNHIVPAVFKELADAFAKLSGTLLTKEGSGYVTYRLADGCHIEMLKPEYLLPQQITLSSARTLVLTTAKADAELFPYQGAEGEAAEIKRAYNGLSMFTVKGDWTLTDITLDGNRAEYTTAANGGIVNIPAGQKLRIADGSSLLNSETTGHGGGVYLAEGANLYLSGCLDFGHPSELLDSINANVGNYGGDALAKYVNGRKPYTAARQDIYIAGYENDTAGSLIIDGLITPVADSDDEYAEAYRTGAIWIWAEKEPHFKQNEQFALLDDSLGLSDAQLSQMLTLFRNARDDQTTENATEKHLYGVIGATEGYVYWNGIRDSRKVILRKVDQNVTSINGAYFTVYKDTSTTPYITADGEVLDRIPKTAGASNFGILWVGDLPYGTYYLEEIEPQEKWFFLIVDDPDTTNPDPFISEAYGSREAAEYGAQHWND